MPVHRPAPDTNRGNFSKQDLLQSILLAKRTKDRQFGGGPVFLHHNGRCVDVQSSRVDQSVHAVANHLACGLIQIRFEHGHLITGNDRRNGLTNQDSEDVGLFGEIAIAGTVADLLNLHRRHGPELVHHGRHNRRARRCRQLGLHRRDRQRHPLQQLGGCRRWNRNASMGDLNVSRSRRHRRTDNGLDSELLERDGGTDDVGDRIDGAHFMKVHFANRRAMHLRLGLTQTCKDAHRQILLSGCQLAGSNHVGNVVKMAMSVLLGMMHL